MLSSGEAFLRTLKLPKCLQHLKIVRAKAYFYPFLDKRVEGHGPQCPHDENVPGKTKYETTIKRYFYRKSGKCGGVVMV